MNTIRHISLTILMSGLLTIPVLAQRSERPRLDEGGGSAHSSPPQGISSSERIPPMSPDNTLQLTLGQGIRVEDHPNGFGRHAAKALEFAEACDLDTALPCAHILWEMRYGFPITGARHLASVPDRVKLRGAENDLSWVPSVHCVTWDTRRRIRYKVSLGQNCTNIVDAETQRMEWHIGGYIEGDSSPVPGVYEGWIPVSVTANDRHWIVDVPITYQRFPKESSCSLNAGGNLFVRGLPYSLDPAEKRGGDVTITPSSSARTNLALTGDFAELCGSDGTKPSCPTSITATTGWARINPSGSTWTFSVSRVSVSGTSNEGGGTPGEDALWTWTVGYFDYDDDEDGDPFDIQTREYISFTDSVDPYVDADGWTHLFLGGSVEVPDNWPALYADGRTFEATATVTFTCN